MAEFGHIANAPVDATQVEMRLLRLDGEMTLQAIQEALGLTNREHFRKTYLAPALEQGVIEMTLPEKPNSRSQRYRLTALGQRLQEQHQDKPFGLTLHRLNIHFKEPTTCTSP